MRISDWSSDVCSSDLRARRRGRAAERLWLFGCRQARARPARNHAVPPRFGVEAVHLDRGDAAGRGGQDRPRQGRQRLSRFRSEEHTSELQSLMRISYAVFCLTTKNKSKNITK